VKVTNGEVSNAVSSTGAAFSCHSSGYLTRARFWLHSNTPESIFYAAFDLRNFLEAKQSEYLVAQKVYRNRLPSLTEYSKRNAELARIFADTRVQLVSVSRDRFVLSLVYVPIPRRLVDLTEKRLQQYCHAQTRDFTAAEIEDIWFTLFEAFRLSEVCAGSTLRAPVIQTDMDGGRYDKAVLSPDSDESAVLNLLFGGETLPEVSVLYRDFDDYAQLG
jgi:hypothetical protein